MAVLLIPLIKQAKRNTVYPRERLRAYQQAFLVPS